MTLRWCKIPPEKRVWRHVQKTATCWNWTGCTVYGYGRFNDGVTTVMAHRYLYQLLRVPVEKSEDLDHICRNRACVNPDHLRAVSRKTNLLAEGSLSIAKHNFMKTHCKHGHMFTKENTKIKKDGSRNCRKCDAIAHNKRYWEGKQ